ncbi:MAG: hypothetical protein LBU65_05785 [Planctomycetaceae bacterium]|jgi:hypothetical protein|nr:hypothetical protein [Planctomycetaceae bacterium]
MSIEAIDEIYVNVINTMRQYGEDGEVQPVQQVLLRNDRFYGYLFVGEQIQVIWTASDHQLKVSVREQFAKNRKPRELAEESNRETIPIPQRASRHRKAG